jgi:hypothetical protein
MWCVLFFLPTAITILTYVCMCGGGGLEKMICYMKLVFFQRNIHVFFLFESIKAMKTLLNYSFRDDNL